MELILIFRYFFHHISIGDLLGLVERNRVREIRRH